MPNKNPNPNLPPHKTLAELADEYEQQVPVLEKMLDRLNAQLRTASNRALLKHKIAVIDDMLLELKENIYAMRTYYDD